jgi:hypothetical protein
MQDKSVFEAEKIALIEFKMIKGQVDNPENFDINKVAGHQLDNSLQLSFNLDDKLAKADFTISVKTDSKGENESEATGNFHLIFIYRIENLEELAIAEKNKRLIITSFKIFITIPTVIFNVFMNIETINHIH